MTDTPTVPTAVDAATVHAVNTVNAKDRNLPRAVRASLPLASEVAEQLAEQYGVCIRPLEFHRLDTHTGTVETVDVPCGATLEAKCPPCAKRNRQLRMAQCRQGWHLETEPVTDPHPATDEQLWLIGFRADVQAMRDQAERDGEDVTAWDEAIAEIDADINAAGMRGNVLGRAAPKRSRSTRRRQDAPDLPKRQMAHTTLGRAFPGADGRVYRPSMFITLTLPSYGRILAGQGVPVDPATYDYRRAARDALHFSKLVDRFVQNLRRVAGYDVQYFATVEPQKRLAPHLHMAIRGTLPRAEIKAIAAATYHQVWWPAADDVRFDGEHLPVWVERPDLSDGAGYPDRQTGDYLDPATGEVLPTWDEALDRLDADEDAEPLHVIRFGDQVDAKGVLAGTSDADMCIGYLSKYLTKSLGDAFDGDKGDPRVQARRDHAARLVEALRYEPCSPGCANWLRYGVQPKGAKAGDGPGPVPQQGAQARTPRLRRTARARLPQVVQQDLGRTQTGPARVGAGNARPRRRPGRSRRSTPLRLATGTAQRSEGDPSGCAAVAGHRRSTAMARHHAATPGQSRRTTPTRSFGNSGPEGGGVTKKTKPEPTSLLPELARGRLLTIEEAAERLNTTVRFPRRLIAERRITFVHVGRNVRIPEAALEAFIAAGVVQPITTTRRRRAA